MDKVLMDLHAHLLTGIETLFQSLSNGKLKMLPSTAIEDLELPLPGECPVRCRNFGRPVGVL